MKAILIIVFTLSVVSLFCATLTVDNNVPSIGQYTTLQAAHDAASNGDKIILIPSNEPYYGINVTKQLDIIGSGWNPIGYDSFFIRRTMIYGTMNYISGSSGSSITSFGGAFSLYINVSDLIVKKCDLGYLYIQGSIDCYANILIAGNRIGVSSNDYYPIHLARPNSLYNVAFTFLNNVIVSRASQIITNDVNYGGAPLNGNCRFINNTMISATNGNLSTYPGSDIYAVLVCNIITSTLDASPNYSYNISGQPARDCISADYHTLAGSAAIDAGNPNMAFNDLDGTRNDCGAYGGPTPFVDGGITGLPAIYEINGPGVATPNETIPIQIKAKTNRD